LAFSFGLLVAEDFAGDFFHFAFRLLGGTFDARKKDTAAKSLRHSQKMAILPILLILPVSRMSGDTPLGRQSRTMSLVEWTANVVVGFLLALLTQIALFPLFGLVVSAADNILIGSIFTAVSLVRSFTLRRFFEAVRARAGRHATNSK
jgi:hypothetical protein